jgi:hypothetical protein
MKHQIDGNALIRQPVDQARERRELEEPEIELNDNSIDSGRERR